MASSISDFWKLLEEIQGTDTDLTDAVKAIAKGEKSVSESLFSNIIDQTAYNSQDYQRIRSFLRDWYAAHRSLTKYQSNISDIYQMPNDQLDELFQSFGYNYSASLREPTSNNPTVNKINFFLDLVNLYKIKGSPQALIDVLQYYGLTDVDLYEISLQFDDRAASLSRDIIFKGKIISGTTGDTSPIYFPFDLLTQDDPHWFQTESQIKHLVNTQKINFPSQTPYFAVKPMFDEVATDAATGILQRYVQDQYDKWEVAGFPPEDTNPVLPQDNIISITGDQCSLLTGYLACIYIFNKEYEVGAPATRFVCYDGTNTDSSDIIAEFQSIASKPSSRADQKSRYAQYLEEFTRDIGENFLQTHSDAGYVLGILNPTVKSNLDSLVTDNETILGSLLRDLGEWARANISYGFINISYILFGIDSMFGQLRDVVEFFKPYRARLIPIEMLQLKNRLFNSLVIEDSYSFDNDVSFHDILVGDSTACCSDATCSALYHPREYYDCGSYHDIGAVTDLPDNLKATLDDSYTDYFRCPSVDTTGYVVSEILSGEVIFPKSMVIPQGVTELEINYELGQYSNYALAMNIYNEVDLVPSIIPFTVIEKTVFGCKVLLSDTVSTDNYHISWDQTLIDGTNTAGIVPIPDGTNRVSIAFSTPADSTDYSISFTIENLVDSSAFVSQFLLTVVEKTLNGCTVELSSPVEGNNYKLAWTRFKYGRNPFGSYAPETGLFHIPIGISAFSIPFESVPYELFDNYTIAGSIINTEDSVSSQYGYIIRSKDIYGFSVILSSPTDSTNYIFSWALPLSASYNYENFSFRQTGQIRDFDEDGTFDCTHGMDQMDLVVEDVLNFMLQENGDFILQEDGNGRLIL